jgi:hypothetical protein
MTDESAFKTVKTLLPRLSPSQLAEVRRHIDGLAQFVKIPQSDEPEAEVIDDEPFVLEVIAKTLTDMGVECSSRHSLWRGDGSKEFKAKCPELMRWLRRVVRTRTEQRAVLKMGVTLLYENMVKAGFPASARTVRNHIHRVPSVINQAFPGYAKNGMLALIVRKRDANGSLMEVGQASH